MSEITVEYLRQNLPDIRARVAIRGEEFEVTCNGKPAFRLGPIRTDKERRGPQEAAADGERLESAGR
jgi:antitoxin (DNA-binding transcriptional repressor) of toxin-antitoxin stability system